MTCSTSPQAEHRRQHLASEEPTYLAAAEYFFKLLTIFLPAPILIVIGTIVERVSWRVHPVAHPPCRIHMSQSLHRTSTPRSLSSATSLPWRSARAVHAPRLPRQRAACSRPQTRHPPSVLPYSSQCLPQPQQRPSPRASRDFPHQCIPSRPRSDMRPMPKVSVGRRCCFSLSTNSRTMFGLCRSASGRHATHTSHTDDGLNVIPCGIHFECG